MKRLLTFVALLLVASCYSVGTRVAPDTFSKIKRGETTKEQVVFMLGQPQTVSLTDQAEESYVYHFVNVGFAGSSVEQQMIVVVFGSDNIVSKASTFEQKQ